MPKQISIRVDPDTFRDPLLFREFLARTVGCRPADISGHRLLRHSIDARGRQVKLQLQVLVFLNEEVAARQISSPELRDVHRAKQQVVVVGAGPAGLFAALQLITEGIRPIILERGKDVRERRRDLAILNRSGVINENSNYCFGEGGAGTYSDGKLYTRSTKRGDVQGILEWLVHFGADENILYEAHPHIGTNKLPTLISSIREQIVGAGGQIHFNERVIGIQAEGEHWKELITETGTRVGGSAFVLATGHSARDIFHLLLREGLHIEAKALALGVRVEHPQALIDSIQYHCSVASGRPGLLPAASYQLAAQVSARGVFSFCMCPGGIIATASTAPGELVVNGWSPSKRNNPFANSGIVVQVEAPDAFDYLRQRNRQLGLAAPDSQDPLLLMHFQQAVEQDAFRAGGGSFRAPAQRLGDFVHGRLSADLPKSSYIPGTQAARLGDLFPTYMHQALKSGFLAFAQKMKGYLTNEAIVVATESRTSSPVRVPRDPVGLHHPQVRNLFPCGEGAGYAGGIVSAAMDGIRVAHQVSASIQ